MKVSRSLTAQLFSLLLLLMLHLGLPPGRCARFDGGATQNRT